MRTYVINLDHRTDRMEEMEYANVPFPYERFSATHSDLFTSIEPNRKKRGHMACHSSHLRLLKKIREDEDEMVLILEDDCDFIENSKEELDLIMNHLPDDWDLLYLGGISQETELFDQKINKAIRILQTHAYIVRRKFLDTLIPALENKRYNYDIALSECLGLGKCFISTPVIAVQRDSKSDIVK